MPGDGRPVVQVDHVPAVGPRTRARPHRSCAGTHRDAVALEREPDRHGIAGVLGGHEPRAGLADRHRDAEPRVDLRELAAGRAAAQDDEALRQLARQRRFLVGPGMRVRQALERRDPGARSDRDHDVPPGDLVLGAVVGDRDDAARRDPGRPAIADGAGRLERLDMRRVVGLLGIGRAVDHVVAPLGGPFPAVARAAPVAFRGVEEALRRDAPDVRARAAEPAAVDHRHRRAELARLVRGGLAGRAGTDDDEVEGLHGPHGRGLGQGLPRCRRASYSSTAAAIETLRLSATPSIGSRTAVTPSPDQASVRPPASLPSTIAHEPRRSAPV